MKLSVVFTGRNDNYGGDFAKRAVAALGVNQGRAREWGTELEIEWVFVEWNPLPIRLMLSYRLSEDFGCTCYVVPPFIHERVTDLDHGMVFMTAFASNVGIRRATGDWILVTNPDVIIDRAIFGYLAMVPLKLDVLYRAQRFDVPLAHFGAHDMENHLGLDHGRGYTSGAGDFMLFNAKQSVGFDEAINYSDIHLDSRFARNWMATRNKGSLKPNEHYYECIGKVYKADHSMVYRRTTNLKKHHRGKKGWESKKRTCKGPALYENSEDWGLVNEEQYWVTSRICILGL